MIEGSNAVTALREFGHSVVSIRPGTFDCSCGDTTTDPDRHLADVVARAAVEHGR